MTNEEVVKHLEELRDRCNRLKYSAGKFEYYDTAERALDIAISAVCSYHSGGSNKMVDHVAEVGKMVSANIDLEAWEPCAVCNRPAYLMGDHYCPHCGRPLTPEARAMLEKRLRGCNE